jgi:hypothetical protein
MSQVASCMTPYRYIAKPLITLTMNRYLFFRSLSIILLPVFLVQGCQKTQSNNISTGGTNSFSHYVKRITETGYNTSGLSNSIVVFTFSYNADSSIKSIDGSNGFNYSFQYNSSNQLAAGLYTNPDNSFYGDNYFLSFEYKNNLVSRTLASSSYPATDTLRGTYYFYSSNNNLTSIILPNLISGGIFTSIDNIQYGSTGNIDFFFDNHDSTGPGNIPSTNTYKYSSKEANICPANNRIAFTAIGMFKLWGPLFYSFFSKEITSITLDLELYTYTYEYNSDGWATKVTENVLGSLTGNPEPVRTEYVFEY